MRRVPVLWLALLAVGCGAEPLTPLSPPPVVSSSDPFSLTLNVAIGSGDQAGHATLTATVRNVTGLALAGVPVSFSTDVGALAAGSAMTAADGTASTQLVANQTAHVKASAGTLTQQTLVAAEPTQAVIPPSPPFVNPPPVVITPIVLPPPPPALLVMLTASAPSVDVAAVPNTLTFTATVSQLDTAHNETVTSYRWDLDGDSNGVYEFTSTGSSPQMRTSAPYMVGGVYTAHVLVTSSLGRQAQGSVSFVVTN